MRIIRLIESVEATHADHGTIPSMLVAPRDGLIAKSAETAAGDRMLPQAANVVGIVISDIGLHNQ
jgi:hypothetical protein